MTDRQGVEIDYCPNCRGVWLDRGELDKIIERSSTSYQEPPRNQRDSRGHSEHGRGGQDHGSRHGHRSFLSRIFD
ncbi:TFIIB-type zinc ribbon-containing protein [Rhizobium sp. 21-4511-3d]